MTNIQLTKARPNIQDIDTLPIPDGSLIDYEKYNQDIGQAMVKHVVYMQATRGCPYHCTYCFNIWPKRHSCRSAENIFSEVKLYYQMGVRRFAFIDDIFNLNIKNSLKFFKMVIKSGMNVNLFFPAGLRGDILTESYIDTMIEAGTINAALALETASPRLQKLIKKNLNIKKLRQNILYITKKYPQFILELFTMHGFPSETESEAKITMDFIKSIHWIHFPYINILRIYPKTEMESFAIRNGISKQGIINSMSLSYHELPQTMPFNRNFTYEYQAEFLNEYFLKKERLLSVLPYQMRMMTENEIVKKYNSYLPEKIKSFGDILKRGGISKEEFRGIDFIKEKEVFIQDLNKKLSCYFPRTPANNDALRVLLLDLTQEFSNNDSELLYDVSGIPLGLMYILTSLKKKFGSAVDGIIAKSKIDFDSFDQLETLTKQTNPQVIGIRTLTFFKSFFHETVQFVRSVVGPIPIIAGGPYATCNYDELLLDKNINMAVIGEGEITFLELIQKIIENNGKLPDEEILREIPGLAFIPGNTRAASRYGFHFRQTHTSQLLNMEQKNLMEAFIEDIDDE